MSPRRLETKLTENEFKICGKCKKRKPLTEYWKHSSGGTQNACRDCMTKQRRERKERSREPGKGEYRCNKCDEIKPEADFYVHKNKRYGPTVGSYCRKCTIEINIESQNRQKGNRDKDVEKRPSLKSKLAFLPKNYPIWE